MSSLTWKSDLKCFESILNVPPIILHTLNTIDVRLPCWCWAFYSRRHNWRLWCWYRWKRKWKRKSTWWRLTLRTFLSSGHHHRRGCRNASGIDCPFWRFCGSPFWCFFFSKEEPPPITACQLFPLGGAARICRFVGLSSEMVFVKA